MGTKLPQQELLQPLDQVRVVEWTEALAGPYCGMLLGDLGASVIKVERPGKGDQSRGWGPPFAGSESTYFLSANRNKRSLTLNLNHPRGVEILRKLVGHADVFVHNQPRRESLVKRGLDYESVSAANPRLIYCAISGYGWSGPKTGLPGYDILAQSEAGIMSITGEPGGKPISSLPAFPGQRQPLLGGCGRHRSFVGPLLPRAGDGRNGGPRSTLC